MAWVGVDLVVAGGFGLAQFQPVQRAFAGQRRAVGARGGQLVRQDRHDWIVAQLVMVVEVLVAQVRCRRCAASPGLDGVFGEERIAAVLEAGSQAAGQAEHLVGGTQ
jgi:hypothetical protein